MVPEDLQSKQEARECDDDASIVKLRNLEQHISQRIHQLAEASPELADELELPVVRPPVEDSAAAFMPPFEPYDQYHLPLSREEHNWRAIYHEVNQSHQGTNELLHSVHELTDLLTDCIRQLNIRLNALEDKIGSMGELEEKIASLETSKTKDHRHFQEIKLLLKETVARIDNLQQAGMSPSADGERLAAPVAELPPGMEARLAAVEEALEQSSRAIKEQVDDRSHYLREQLERHAKVMEKLSFNTRDYLNRHFFSLAVLVIIIVFVAGALVTNSLDRMATYLTQSIDTLRTSVDEMSAPPAARPPRR